MVRAVAAVVGGLLAWAIVATIVNFLLRIALPGYAEIELAMRKPEGTMTFTLEMLVLRLLMGVLASLGAGFVAAWIARRNGTAVKVLAGLLLAAFIPIHYGVWERFPVWYHLFLLASLVVVTILGANCYSYFAGRGVSTVISKGGSP